MFFLNRVDHQEVRDSTGQADGMPAFLIIYDAIQVRHCLRILKDPCSRHEGNAVFSPVDAVLVFVPGENHLYIQNCSTRFWEMRSKTGTTAACGPVSSSGRARVFADSVTGVYRDETSVDFKFRRSRPVAICCVGAVDRPHSSGFAQVGNSGGVNSTDVMAETST
jgi:hypothetical protein